MPLSQEDFITKLKFIRRCEYLTNELEKVVLTHYQRDVFEIAFRFAMLINQRVGDWMPSLIDFEMLDWFITVLLEGNPVTSPGA